jgi:lysozyme
MKTSEAGIDLIKSFESFRGKAYLDPAGVPTIGWGTTKICCGTKVQLGMEINEAIGEVFLAYDLINSESDVMGSVKIKLNQNQFDALVSFQYNIGRIFSTTLLKTINSEGIVTKNMFTRWNKAMNPITGELVALPGLTRRREAEYNLYVKK